jgi:predicted small metal-binding protein
MVQDCCHVVLVAVGVTFFIYTKLKVHRRAGHTRQHDRPEEGTMSRKTIDCGDLPNDIGCTLAITGEENEVLLAATAHAVEAHGHADDHELRATLRSLMRDVSETTTEEGSFIQLIEFRTRHIDEFDATVERWAGAIGAQRTARWAITAGDRDQPHTYLQAVEFPSYDSAMANSNNPTTTEFAHALRSLCDTDPIFRNLDVHRATTF